MYINGYTYSVTKGEMDAGDGSVEQRLPRFASCFRTIPITTFFAHKVQFQMRN